MKGGHIESIRKSDTQTIETKKGVNPLSFAPHFPWLGLKEYCDTSVTANPGLDAALLGTGDSLVAVGTTTLPINAALTKSMAKGLTNLQNPTSTGKQPPNNKSPEAKSIQHSAPYGPWTYAAHILHQ
jgi:hypothetical protein